MSILYIVPTPIGNMEDITLRARRVLSEVDFVACEDSRVGGKLMLLLGLKKPLYAYHEHNKQRAGEVIAERIAAGEDCALITDAGTPAVSDPGEDLVRLCRSRGIEVIPLPGACAAVTALSASGLPSRRFCFEGFLPTDKKEKAFVLEELARETRTMILYEAPHHLKRTLSELLETLGERRITLCRELTKKFETIMPTTLEGAADYYEENEPKGEYVLVIEGKSRKEIEEEQQKSWESMSIEEHMAFYEKQGIDRKSAMKKVAADRGVGKREIYQALLKDE